MQTIASVHAIEAGQPRLECNIEVSSLNLNYALESALVEDRSTRRIPNSRCSATPKLPFLARFSRISTAAWPISYFGWWIVVRGGRTTFANSTLPNPMSEISSGNT